MGQTPSNMLALGTIAPNFLLPDVVSKKPLSLDQLRGEKGTVVMFICNHCPYVIHINEEIVRLANDYRVAGFGFVAIMSNNTEAYPQDHPDFMENVARKYHYPFPYLYDATQEVAKAYQAACTPDFYLFDTDLKLVYRGQLDNSRPGNGIPTNGRDLREALDAILKNDKIPENQKPSMGCSIKWKK
ncbi:thioredoxin family protein [Gillisia sp. M10.2A]|uniref:Thioredoxin family protein n=1 Tax=Gillisia lutea TaxID=2909668 RepID=A0ABS9EL19_9FLAO|nr:thioredoxin family protein [Gillisia lutea]MCF4102151.1 thioredoxin family protein [Gillisia lutea]